MPPERSRALAGQAGGAFAVGGQAVTTGEPDDSQLEVAIRALREVI